MLKKIIIIALFALPILAYGQQSIFRWSQGGTNSAGPYASSSVIVSDGTKFIPMATSSLGISGSGTVSSVDMTVPLGLAITGNPITTSGTLALSLASGYVIPKSASTTEWDTAYSWGNHASAGYLTNLLGGLDAILGNSTTTALTISGLATPAGAYLAVNPLGQVIATTTPSGGGGTWGSITGTLSAQTDLQNALNDKASLSLPNTFSAHNIFSSLFATNASSTNSTSTISYVSSKLSVASTSPSESHELAVQGEALISGTTTTTVLKTTYMNDEEILNISDAIFSTTTPDGLNHRPVGYDTSGFNKYLVFYGNVDNDVSWDFVYPSKCASSSNAYLDLWVKATTTSNDAVFNAYFWRQDEGTNVDTSSSYDSANIATSSLPATASQIKKLTIPLTNRDYMSGGSTGRFKLMLSGTSTTSAGYFFVKEKLRFYCE